MFFLNAYLFGQPICWTVSIFHENSTLLFNVSMGQALFLRFWMFFHYRNLLQNISSWLRLILRKLPHILMTLISSRNQILELNFSLNLSLASIWPGCSIFLIAFKTPIERFFFWWPLLWISLHWLMRRHPLQLIWVDVICGFFMDNFIFLIFVVQIMKL